MHSKALVLGELALDEEEEKLPSLEELMQPATFLAEVTNLVVEDVVRLQKATEKITQLRKQLDDIQEKLKKVPHPLADKMMAMWDQEERKRVDPFAGLSDKAIEMKAESLRSSEVKEMRAEVLRLQQVLIDEQQNLNLKSKIMDLMHITASLSSVMERDRALWHAFGRYCYVAAELHYHKLVYYKYQMPHYLLDQYGETRDGLQRGFRFYIGCAKKYLPVNARKNATDLQKLGEQLFKHFNRKYDGYIDTRIPEEDLPTSLAPHASRYFPSPEQTPKVTIDPLERMRRQLQNWINEFYEVHNPVPIYCPTLEEVEQSLSEDDQQKINQMTRAQKKKFLKKQQSDQYNAAIQERLVYLQNIMEVEFAWIKDEETHNQLGIYLLQLLHGKRNPELNLTQMPVTKNETEEKGSSASVTESEAEEKSSFTPTSSTGVKSEMRSDDDSIPFLELPSPALSALLATEAQAGVKLELANADAIMQAEQSPTLVAAEGVMPFVAPLEPFALAFTSIQMAEQEEKKLEVVTQPGKVAKEADKEIKDEPREEKTVKKKKPYKHPLGDKNELLAVDTPYKDFIKLITIPVRDEAAEATLVEQVTAVIETQSMLLQVTSLEPLAYAHEKEKCDIGLDALMYAAKYCESPKVITLLLQYCPVNSIHNRQNKDNGKTAYQLGEKNSVFQVAAALLRSPKATRSVTGKHARDKEDATITSSQFWLSDKAKRSAAVAASANGFFGCKKQATQKQLVVQESRENTRNSKCRRLTPSGEYSD